MKKPFRALNAVLFFALKPDERLTAKGLEIRLCMSARAVPTLLNRSCKSGLLTKDQDPQGRVTYRAGPELLKLMKGMERWL